MILPFHPMYPGNLLVGVGGVEPWAIAGPEMAWNGWHFCIWLVGGAITLDGVRQLRRMTSHV